GGTADSGDDSVTVAIAATVTVANANDAPTVANAQANFNLAEDAALDYDFAANTFADADSGDSCTYTSTQTDGSALPGWLTFTAGDRNYAGTPVNANVGTLDVRTTCTDGSGSAVNDDFTITITNTNDAPTTSGGAATIAEDATHTFTTTASDWGYTDVDSGDALVTVDITTLPGTGTLRYSNADVSAGDDIAIGNLGGLTYVPVGDAFGAVTFTFKVNDGDAWSASAGTFTMTYTSVNDAPVNTLGTPNAVNEDVANAITGNSIADVDDTSMTSVAITASRGTFSLAQTTGLTFASNSGDGTDDASMTFGGTVANINSAIATLTWTSAADDNTDATITVVTTDDDGASDTDTMSITVNAVNDAPTSAAVTVAGTEDTLKTFAASNFAFSDADSGSSISRILITIVESTGDLECNNKNGLSAGWEDCAANDYVAAGTDLRLTPASNSVADVTFSFKVYDGAAYSAAAYIFTTTHAAVNDAPTWTTSAVDVSGNEDTAITIGANVIADVDDSDMTMTVSSDNSGTFTLGAGIGDLTFSAGDGTADTTMTFSGTVTEVNAALNSIAWTSASNDNTNSVLTLTAND
ncbi:MAG: hypothetical protein GY903_08685, partial [Fuerstiella sp.]|nr:hypothetical protein [Fuerstiella sp.]